MLRGLDGVAVVVGSNLSALERAASRDAKYIDRTAHCKAIAPLTGLALSLLFIASINVMLFRFES